MKVNSLRLKRSFLANSPIIFKHKFLFLIALSFLCISTTSHGMNVAFAGYAYSGDYQSIESRFPYSKRFEASQGGPTGTNDLLKKSLTSIQPKGYTLVPRIDELAGDDQVIAVALVITNETVSTDQIGHIYKLLVQIRGQALFYDFKSQTILRAYPFSFAYIDALSATPTESQKDESIGHVFLGTGGKPGIFERFGQALTQATIPTNVPRFVQVSNVAIGDEARGNFPPEYEKGAAETWVADTFGEAIANKMGIPILPFTKGYAIGNVMSMTISDGTVFNLKLPKPDYEFSVNISKLRKVVFDEKAAGKSLIYGTYASLKLEESLSTHAYLDGQFKNGEVKVVPATQVNTEDFPAFQDSMRGLFTKLSGAIAGDNTPWLKSAASGNDVDKQIASTRELLQSCK